VGLVATRGTVVEGSLSFLGITAGFALVGALIAARRPRNPIGWLCLGFGLAGGSQVAAYSYAIHGLITEPGSLPGAQFAAWWAGWAASPVFSFLTSLLPLLFPTGRPPSPRWRPVLLLSLVTMAVATLSAAFSPGPLSGAPEFVNPIGLGILGEVAPALTPLSPWLLMASMLLATASLIVRYRRAQGPERQQLKWFFGAFLLVFGSLFITSAVGTVFGESRFSGFWSSVVFPVTVLTIPIAIGIAVLRYRLYDIDLLINRTLVYGTLTALLAAAYVGAIALLQVVLQPFTQGSQLAVAASTLAVAALFQPLRARIQRVVDRRFYRSRYDAERTVDRFAGRLRDELDLAALSAELIGVVGETVRPARAGLWLRER
jgi:MFS family permease